MRRFIAAALAQERSDIHGIAVPQVVPPRSHRLIPVSVRNVLTSWGWWQGPVAQPPSVHLLQVRDVLKALGWAQSLDITVTGRMCVRGAQSMLERTGHVTGHDRERAVQYMQKELANHGVTMAFHAWNDLPEQTLQKVEGLLTAAARMALENGE
ncbi:hypothetical protein OG453_44545 [Streptomyces sp. NBC_01381]|uniref:DUF6197 family protein n=1 Tax=Streptomyces sp. NBC_01381 TaxID=2903845 RepID=UPI00225809A8|nr:hypothetical protein [Streptomyces sp. NBC_01381]MCX4673629.1 hypothetical protein [Streptomyces sp. NBC_01381]